MAKRVKKICPTCGKEFEVLESRLKWGGTFCSEKCHRNRKKNKITKKCIICDKNYEIWPYEEKLRAPTCSVECTKEYIQERYNKRVICPTCKKEFWTSKKNPLKHCSMECRNISYIGKNMTGDHRVCPSCEKRFYVQKARLERGEGIYCSSKCVSIGQKKSIEQRIKEGGLVELECSWCRKKFVRSRYFKDIQRYCSEKCAKRSKNETIIETKTREALERQGAYFEQEKAIKSEKKKYFVDFFLPPKIIIECDGKFWHNPSKFPKSFEKDKIKINFLRRRGYKVYILKEDEIHKRIDKLISKIIRENPEIKFGQGSKVKPRNKTIIIKVCKYCGKQFETIPSREKNNNFCNLECKNNFHRVKLKCDNCNKTFFIKRFLKYKRFCSIICRTEFTKKKNTKTCLNCGNKFSPNPADIKRGKAKFCSRACVIKYRYHR